MIRITIIEIASFFLPFLLFFIWRWQTRSEVKLTATPALKLGVAGAVLAIAAMIALAMFDASRGGHEGDRYVPPRVVDGRVVPGHFVPAGEVGTDEAETPEPEDEASPQ
ncbi:MAG: DUF6111 family protein [Pseudomonadota bacterium]|nr:DUF6111 family protein [Pseudomonadota bacterium]